MTENALEEGSDAYKDQIQSTIERIAKQLMRKPQSVTAVMATKGHRFYYIYSLTTHLLQKGVCLSTVS